MWNLFLQYWIIIHTQIVHVQSICVFKNIYICDPSRRNGHVGGMTPYCVIDTSLKSIS